MDMDGMAATPTTGPGLSGAGLNLSSETIASDFLAAILDDGVLQPEDWAYAEAFWYGVIVVIGISSIINLIRLATSESRLRAAAAKRPRPAQSSNAASIILASITTVVREISYPQLSPSRTSWFRIPPFGPLILILVYLGFIFGLQFYNSKYPGAQYWEAIGLRSAWLTVAQFPLLILLAGKTSILGLVVGVSYERLQIYHRWVARAMLTTATLHGGYQAYGWVQDGVFELEYTTDSCIPTGFSTWVLLLWLVFSSMTPFRNIRYEFFVIQHIISFIGFLVAVFYHIPAPYALNARIFIWLGIGFFLLDRLIRYTRSAIHNRRLGKATLTSLPGNVTRISVHAPMVKKWTPGQHILLCLPHLGLGQSHPATIASTPSSHGNDLVFFLRAHRGFTNRVLTEAASASTESLLEERDATMQSTTNETFNAFIDGPYGGSQSDFAAFDTAVLIAGSTGVTFTLPILLDLAQRAQNNRLPIRRVVFIWMIKSTDWAVWIINELQKAIRDLHEVGTEVEAKIYVTCDPTFTESGEDTRRCGCDCDVRLGPCCCERTGEDDITPVPEKSTAIITSEKATSSPALSVLGSTTTPTTRKEFNPVAARLLKFATLQSGRPNFKSLLWDLLDKSQGETGVAVCGPPGLSMTVRNTVAAVSDQRGAAKGTGADGVYLHSECYYW